MTTKAIMHRPVKMKAGEFDGTSWLAIEDADGNEVWLFEDADGNEVWLFMPEDRARAIEATLSAALEAAE